MWLGKVLLSRTGKKGLQVCSRTQPEVKVSRLFFRFTWPSRPMFIDSFYEVPLSWAYFPSNVHSLRNAAQAHLLILDTPLSTVYSGKSSYATAFHVVGIAYPFSTSYIKPASVYRMISFISGSMDLCGFCIHCEGHHDANTRRMKPVGSQTRRIEIPFFRGRLAIPIGWLDVLSWYFLSSFLQDRTDLVTERC